jgi:glutamyl-tRNA reductase
MNIIVAGLSHKTAPIEIREKLSFSSHNLSTPLQEIVNFPSIDEAIILSTCNRVEIVCTAADSKKVIHEILLFLAEFHKLSLDEITPHLYFYSGQDAIRHVFRVASSLDSMIIGEPQILGQLKDAYHCAVANKTTGSILNRFLHKTFSVAKRVRTETNIASSAVSISFAAVELARKIFDTIEDKKILLIGAGEMAELVTRHLVSLEVKGLFISNRTFEHALPLAKDFGGKVLKFDELSGNLSQMDIIISSTDAQDILITYEKIVQALHARKNKPMFLIDIGVPRNIDPRVNDLPNVYLYNIDDLDGIVEKNRLVREKEAKQAENIVEEEQKRFYTWLQQQEVTPTILTLKQKFESIRLKEIEKTFSRWEGLREEDREKVNALTHAIVNKIIHDPINFLKNKSQKKQFPIEEIKRIFNLNDDDDA